MLETLCIACQYGNHESHLEGQAPPPGMMGGWRCTCTGDCAENATVRDMVPGLSVAFDPTPLPEPLNQQPLEVVRRWMDSLDHPPTAEEILGFAEGYS